jgi:hypothetical protein
LKPDFHAIEARYAYQRGIFPNMRDSFCALQIRLWDHVRERTMKHKLALLILTSALTIPVLAQAANIDWEKVDAALGKTAAVSGDVHRYGLPRSDLTVTLDHHHAIASTDSPPLASRMRFTTGTAYLVSRVT